MFIFYILNLFFNKYLDAKYFINKLLFTPSEDTKIEKIYFINPNNEVNIKNDICLKSINSKLNYCAQINLNELISPKNQNQILQIEYIYKQKPYIFNIDCNRILNEIVYFPHYTEKELKTKNMNKIVSCNLGDDYVKVLNKYSGPLNDFYLSKGLGIPLNKIYYQNNFLFRNKSNITFDDLFLNTYNIQDITKVIEIKSTLSDNKITNKSIDLNKSFFKNIFNKKKIL